MKTILTLALCLLSACSQISIACPDGKSTVVYRGTNLASSGPLAVSCGVTNNTVTAMVTGTDIVALATAVAPLVPLVAAKAPNAR